MQPARAIMGAGGLLRLAYGLGALIAPDRLSNRVAPDVRGHAPGRMDFRGFGGLHVNVAAATLLSAFQRRHMREVLTLNLGCEIADTAVGLLEWRDRGGLDRIVTGSLVLSLGGAAAWAGALRTL